MVYGRQQRINSAGDWNLNGSREYENKEEVGRMKRSRTFRGGGTESFDLQTPTSSIFRVQVDAFSPHTLGTFPALPALQQRIAM
jgi:hypothetical protein